MKYSPNDCVEIGRERRLGEGDTEAKGSGGLQGICFC